MRIFIYNRDFLDCFVTLLLYFRVCFFYFFIFYYFFFFHIKFMYKFVSSTNENHHSLNVNDTCKCAYNTRNEIWQSRIRAARLNTIHFLLFRHKDFFFVFDQNMEIQICLHKRLNISKLFSETPPLNQLGKIISFTAKLRCWFFF